MAYNGRGNNVNVLEFVNQLNAIPSAQDLQAAEDFNLGDDLAMFTNTQFFDFDLGQDADLLQPAEFDGEVGAPAAASKLENMDLKPMDFGLQGDFGFPDFNAFTLTPAPAFGQDVPHPDLQPDRPHPASGSSVASPDASPPTSGTKRKPSSPPEENDKDASQLAAEEDKRRRNTAASARFRVKKKQREQALERSAKEMSDKVTELEGRVNQLETENKWLKNLITEKNESREDIATLWKKYGQEIAERKASERKDGVGTKA